MLRFLVRRSAYSILIFLGVVLLTFLLFNVAAGDPVAATLGKDPSPQEIELLRAELGADLPIIWGQDCRTEAYASFDGQNMALPNSVSFIFPNSYQLLPQKVVCNDPIELIITGGVIAHVENATPIGNSRFRVIDSRKAVELQGEDIGEVKIVRVQPNSYNSQFFRTLKEVISFSSTFPYIKVLDFGNTLTTREPIQQILIRGVGPSLALMLPIFLGEMVLGIVLALIATVFKDRFIDRALVLFSVVGLSVSYLVLIIFAQWYLGYYCNLFPVWGWGDVRYLILPVVVGVLSGLGGNVRFYRTVFIDEMRREYLRTAAAKGCSVLSVYGVHLLRNAAIPIITRASAALPFLFTGSLLLEAFFGIPGLGFAAIDALNNSDIQLLKALVIVSAILFLFLNLVADIAYAWADPRIRLE